MSQIDWIILVTTLLMIVGYGIWKTRGHRNIHQFLLGGNDAKWWTIGLSVMATQASAITFLSTPGQAFDDGMGFVQFYFGLPLAMVVICAVFIPIYHRLKVYTAYEFLESRFDLKSRTLAAGLFLLQRGLGAGITIFAPSIILSSILGWNLRLTCLLIGVLVTIYTVSGGTKAVSLTHKLQMFVIFAGMFFAFGFLLAALPEGQSFSDALKIAGATGKMQVIDMSFEPNNRYTLWTGLLGGFFLQLGYFGSDQSQVQRYLTGRSVKESQLGLIMNGLLKIPMQFFILLVGIMVFVFYQNTKAPVFFNTVGIEAVQESTSSNQLSNFENQYDELYQERQGLNEAYLSAWDDPGQKESIQVQINRNEQEQREVREDVRELVATVNPAIETNDRDYVFIHFILNHLPKGLIGLLLAVIFSAAMSSTASELNALASTTTIDIYKRSFRKEASDQHYLNASRGFTIFWGLVAILFACFGTLFENLIQFVNIVGSVFYGTILGLFITAFFFKWIRGNAAFIAAIISQVIVLLVFWQTDISFLWYNVIGCLGVVFISMLIQGRR